MHTRAWFLIALSSVALFIVTGNPLIASAIPYIMGGARGILTAFWLRSVDPIVSRGKTYFWFYIAAAGWEAATTAFLHLLLFVAIEECTGVMVAVANFGLFAQTMLVLTGGVAVSTVIGMVAIVSALRHRMQVFVVLDLHKLCGGDFETIGAVMAGRRRFNHAIFVLISTLFVPPLVISSAALIYSVTGDRTTNPNTAAVIAELIGFFAAAFLPIFAYIWCSNRIIAPSPAVCWLDH